MKVYVITVTEEDNTTYVIGVTKDEEKIEKIIQEDIDIYTKNLKYTRENNIVTLENNDILEYEYKLMEVE